MPGFPRPPLTRTSEIPNAKQNTKDSKKAWRRTLCRPSSAPSWPPRAPWTTMRWYVHVVVDLCFLLRCSASQSALCGGSTGRQRLGLYLRLVCKWWWLMCCVVNALVCVCRRTCRRPRRARSGAWRTTPRRTDQRATTNTRRTRVPRAFPRCRADTPCRRTRRTRTTRRTPPTRTRRPSRFRSCSRSAASKLLMTTNRQSE